MLVSIHQRHLQAQTDLKRTMAAENNVESRFEIQPEVNDPNSQMEEAKEISGQDQVNTNPRVQEMKRSGNQIAPMELVPYTNDNIPAASPAPAPKVPINYNIDTRSGVCKNRVSLLLFLVHIVAAGGGIGYFGFLGIRESIRRGKNKFHIEYWYPPLAVAALVGAMFSCVWQTLIRWFPKVMVGGVLWSSPAVTFAAAIFFISTSIPASVGLGAVLLVFSLAQALYACWVYPRMDFAAIILSKALDPTTKLIPDLHHPSYWTILVAFMWTVMWNFGIVGAITNEYVVLVIFGLLVSYAWTMEVLRNVVNVTVSRVIALYYMRGMQSDTQFAFQRAFTTSLGSISLGSLVVPLIESMRVVARTLSLVEGEDEFMFSCVHCCFRVMAFFFRFGNNWAFVQVATYGKSFVKASRDTWELFIAQRLDPLADRDITSTLCFLSGITGGVLCLIVSGSWTFVTHKTFTATVSLISFFIGYFMTRITMAMPHACVCAYYICYAENPQNRLFDNTIPDRIKQLTASMV